MFLTIRHLPKEELRNMRGAIDSECLEIAREVYKNNGYIRVADIETNERDLDKALELAFAYTNSVETPWYESKNIDVTQESKNGCRSTSVGDIVQVNNRTFVVSSYGFEEL